MAQRAFVSGLMSRPKLNDDGSVSMFVRASYVDTNGLQYDEELPIVVGINDSVVQIKTAIGDAVRAKGTALGFTLAVNTIVGVEPAKL